MVVGYDKRFASEHFAATAAEVLAGTDCGCCLTDGPTPTPAISYAVRRPSGLRPVNITASHNPPEDNGFKVRNRFGGAIDPAGLKRIEALIPPDDDQVAALPLAKAISQGRIEPFDAAPPYIEQLKRLVDLEPLRDAAADARGRHHVGQRGRLVPAPARGRTAADHRDPQHPQSRPSPR